jgi:hypothetical protein
MSKLNVQLGLEIRTWPLGFADLGVFIWFQKYLRYSMVTVHTLC